MTQTTRSALLIAALMACLPIAACTTTVSSPEDKSSSVQTQPSMNGQFAPNPEFEAALDANSIYETEIEAMAVPGSVIQ